MASIRGDLGDWRIWAARALVLTFAVLAGLSVVSFTWLCDQAFLGFERLSQQAAWLPLLWTPACLATLVWLTRRIAPGAAGSGIPQVMAALSPVVDEHDRRQFVSLRLSVAKALLTAGGLLGGLAMGREGPSVQIAAGVMHHARRYVPQGAPVSTHGLLVAGGAAGIAAAFNAPLAGIVFAIEELSRRFEQRNSGLIIAAIVLAGLMAVSAFGNTTYFGVIRVPSLAPGFIVPAVLVTLACGTLGGLFSRLLHASLTDVGSPTGRWQSKHPVVFAGCCGLAIAVIGLVSHGATFGSGYEYTRNLLAGHIDLPLLYVTLRFIATWLAVWSGVPGGVFAPSLAIGAGIGTDVAVFTNHESSAPALIALGMAGFLAAVTQAPLTAFIIVMEMVDGHAMVLTLMAAALGASLVSRWISHPLYSSLMHAQLGRLSVSRPAEERPPAS
ncbi:chloride channel protein [Roseateles sp.]|uniref:chloride channel protein n=1 Tax=Roseateles sp. TaxID=1971397 RepID=UPI002DFFEDA6|nr:chloride channel protein [Roseateles sp.]